MTEGLLSRVRTPRPPDDLRDRVLRAARAKAGEVPSPARERWGFTRFDLALAATLLLLVVCNAATGLRSRAPAIPPQPQITAEERQLEEELALKGQLIIAAAPDPGRSREAALLAVEELERL